MKIHFENKACSLKFTRNNRNMKRIFFIMIYFIVSPFFTAECSGDFFGSKNHSGSILFEISGKLNSDSAICKDYYFIEGSENFRKKFKSTLRLTGSGFGTSRYTKDCKSFEKKERAVCRTEIHHKIEKYRILEVIHYLQFSDEDRMECNSESHSDIDKKSEWILKENS